MKNFFYDSIKKKYSIRRVGGTTLLILGTISGVFTYCFTFSNALNVSELPNLSRCLDCLEFLTITFLTSGAGLIGSTTADSFVKK